MSKYKIENISLEEKESYIYIDIFEKSISLYTNDYKILNRISKKIGEPTKVFPTLSKEKNLTKIIISGAEWKYKYEDSSTKDKVIQLFSISNFFPKNIIKFYKIKPL